MVVNAASKCLDMQDTEIKWLDSKESDRAEPNLQIIKSCAQIAFMKSKLDGKGGAGLRDLMRGLAEEIDKAEIFWRIGEARHRVNSDIIAIRNGDCKLYDGKLVENKDSLNSEIESNHFNYDKADTLLQNTLEVLAAQVGLSREIEQIFSGEKGIDELVKKTDLPRMIILDKVNKRIMDSKELSKVPGLEEIAERYIGLKFELKSMQSGRSLVEAVSRNLRDITVEKTELYWIRAKKAALRVVAKDFVVQKPSAEMGPNA